MGQADRHYIELCLNSHPDAYRTLVERYQKALLAYLIGHLGNRTQAEDVAQEAFVRAFFTLDKLAAPDAFFSWLLGIANRVAKEQGRARHRYEVVIGSVPVKRPNSGQSAEPSVEEALAKLPGRYAEVILLRYYSGYSCREVAEHLGVPLGTVTKRLSRAFDMLRGMLRRQECRTGRSKVES